MSVREYIGARYMPVFSDPIQWDSTSSYEPLTVVMNLGTSYVSRQSVPAGIDIANENYWIRWADYNAQLEEYIRQVNLYSSRITTLEGDVDNIEGDISDINTAITAIQADNWVTENRIATDAVTTTKIADANVTTAKIADANVTTAKIADGAITRNKIAANAIDYSMIANVGEMVVIGDSYSYTTYTSENQMWWYLLAQRLNVTPHSYAANGTAFVKTTPSPNFHAQLELAAADTDYDNADVKYVFIYGGYNDCYDASGIGGSQIWIAVRDCLIYAKQQFPNALIVIAGCNTNKNLYVKDTTHWNQQIYAQLMANAVNTQEGAVFLDLTQLFVGEYDFIDTNTDHPNVDGQKAIAQAMLNGLYGMDPYTNMNTILDITSQVTNGSAGSLWLTKHQGVWGITATGVRAGSNGMFTFNIPHNIWTMYPDNCPCLMDSASGNVNYAAIIAGAPGYFNGFANQNANCFITWNQNQKREYMRQGASHMYTI